MPDAASRALCRSIPCAASIYRNQSLGRPACTTDTPPARADSCSRPALATRPGFRHAIAWSASGARAARSGARARFPVERIAISGPSQVFGRGGDSGGAAEPPSCPVCGGTLWWSLDSLPGFVSVAPGAFADPAFPAPAVSDYGVRRHPWVVIRGPASEHFESPGRWIDQPGRRSRRQPSLRMSRYRLYAAVNAGNRFCTMPTASCFCENRK